MPNPNEANNDSFIEIPAARDEDDEANERDDVTDTEEEELAVARPCFVFLFDELFVAKLSFLLGETENGFFFRLLSIQEKYLNF